jgi:hypothetical protein
MSDLMIKVIAIFGALLLTTIIFVPIIDSNESSETVIISEIGYKDSENFYINVLSTDGGISYMTVSIENTIIYREDPAILKENYAVIKSGVFSSGEASVYITNDTVMMNVENKNVPPLETDERTDNYAMLTIIMMPISALIGVYVARSSL